MVEAVPLSDGHRWWSGVSGWVRAKDGDLLVVKRSVRAAVVMPLVFGLTHLLFTNPQTGLFGAFGSFALLLLVDFHGRPRTRLASYGGLFVVGAVFISIGTVASSHKVAAVVAMAVVGFAVLFAGVLSPQAATGSTAALLLFVLPVAVAQPASAVGPRLVGWVAAGLFCISACMLVWPTPWHDNLRRPSVGRSVRAGRAGACKRRRQTRSRGRGAGEDGDVDAPGPVRRDPLSPHRGRLWRGGEWPSWSAGSNGWPATLGSSGDQAGSPEERSLLRRVSRDPATERLADL